MAKGGKIYNTTKHKVFDRPMVFHSALLPPSSILGDWYIKSLPNLSTTNGSFSPCISTCFSSFAMTLVTVTLYKDPSSCALRSFANLSSSIRCFSRRSSSLLLSSSRTRSSSALRSLSSRSCSSFSLFFFEEKNIPRKLSVYRRHTTIKASFAKTILVHNTSPTGSRC